MPSRDVTISREAMVHLWSYDWPGNVRELENMIERLLIMSTDDLIDTPILPPNLVSANRTVDSQIPDKLTDAGLDLNAVVRELEGNSSTRRSSRPAETSRRLRSCSG